MASPEQERNDVITRLTDAVARLGQSMHPALIPDEGGNVAFALSGARSVQDIASVTGGFRRDGTSVLPSGSIAFGDGGRIARALLTARKFDTAVRSAACIRYSDAIYAILSSMFIECVIADPQKKIPDNDTGLMDWTIAACCQDGVPDVVGIHGQAPSEQIIWLFGEDPALLASNIIILSNRIQ